MSQVVTPTCRFCRGQIIHTSTTLLSPLGIDPEHYNYSYFCFKCHSEQDYTQNGRPLGYQFTTDDYTLRFDPHKKMFQIFSSIGKGRLLGELLLTCQFCPTNLTPTNTTKARIKLLILFS
jgi:hypothetical protein